jgi:hypothetical protein
LTLASLACIVIVTIIRYLAAFTADGLKIVPVEWTQVLVPNKNNNNNTDATTGDGAVKDNKDENATTGTVTPTRFWSFLVQMPKSMVVLEFMSHNEPSALLPSPRYIAPVGG